MGLRLSGARLRVLRATSFRTGTSNIGAFISRIGSGVYFTIIKIRNPQNLILIIKAPTVKKELLLASGLDYGSAL